MKSIEFKSVDRTILQPTFSSKSGATLRDVGILSGPRCGVRRVVDIHIDTGASPVNFVANLRVWNSDFDEWRQVAAIYQEDSKTVKNFSERNNRSIPIDFGFFKQDHDRLVRIAAAVLDVGCEAGGKE